ncbi:MAG: LysM peptidoglycan-binding domain-containing protein [Flavobacterium sp.]|uniref:LysM peptidoglycan-binding domain-containing protein n=1 Tax=Flavobacterium sp. TaxID=239 RepID=UPI00263A37CA|nr:LysM peptidoglycan-binding domain-containing protein [Flavobacterium sp.]MDD5149719.1 LysM peptidoglycan-binding domain-containing protein [Flavobacterium sp.]
MKYFSYLFLFVFLIGMSAFSQESYTRHTVSKGETISEIAEQYKVTSKAIYQLNPKAKKGIKYRSVLLIPTKVKKHTASTTEMASNYPEKSHEVLAKETIWGIAKQYKVSVDDLYKINPELEKEGLKKGQTIKIPQKDSDNLASATTPESTNVIPKTDTNNSKTETIVSSIGEAKVETQTERVLYKVLPKETLYSIAKQNKISMVDLKKANPTIGNKPLKAGQKIIVPIKVENNSNLASREEISKTIKDPNLNVALEQEKQSTDLSQNADKANTVEIEITREVLPKETKYGIAKEFGITVAELERQNPKIVKKLPVGYILKIRSSKVMEETISVEEVVVKEQVVKADSTRYINTIHDAVFVDQLISVASENIGTRYRSGGTTKEGFDCSGLVYSTFGTFDIRLPRSSIEMASYGSKISTENAQKGDLIFFKTNGRRQINHVGMVVEVLDGEIKFIHSSNHGGVIISSTKESYYEKNLAQINRVL